MSRSPEKPGREVDAGATATLDRRIRLRIIDRRGEDILALVDQALVSRSANAVLTELLLPAMYAAVDRHLAGHVLLPDLLESAEVMHQAMDHLGQRGPEPAFRKGRVLVATLPGDVHHIGKALLVTVLSACGYTVHDLGSQVPVEEIVDTAVRLQPDAIGLSALLVSTSRQMPLCVQRLDARGVHVPVLIGGAAINRAFGRASGVLPDGRVYQPAVFYCRDVFEGLAALDALVDPARRAPLIAQTRAEICLEAARPSASKPAAPRSRPAHAGPRRDVAVPHPPYWGARQVSADLGEVWRALDRNTLFRYHWGGYRLTPDDLQRQISDVFEPRLAALSDDARGDGWLQPLIVNGYFACHAEGDGLLIYAGPDSRAVLTRLDFPRQPDGEQLCLADYFRPLDAAERDLVALQAVTTGPRAGEYIEELLSSGAYARMQYVSGLAAATTEALAEHAHQLARRDLGLASGRGLRFSWGYPACPDLEEQRKVLSLLDAGRRIGLTLSQSNNLDPEHSTAAIIVHHPEAKYFAVRAAAA